MKPKRSRKRVLVQAGSADRMGRPIPGLFVVWLDEELLRQMMERAFGAQGKKCVSAALTVEYKKIPQSQANWHVANPDEALPK